MAARKPLIHINGVLQELPPGDHLKGQAESAINIALGHIGEVPYQSASSTTEFVPQGLEGQVLAVQPNGLPGWSDIGTYTATAPISVSGSRVISHDDSGAVAGTFNNLTVDAKGHVTAGSNVPYITDNQSITFSGDATGVGTTSVALTLANSGVAAGTYKSVTVDTKGRVTAGTNPTTLSGYGITDAVSSDLLGATSGVATLDSTGRLAASQIPAALVGALQYQGVWDANTNSPSLTTGIGTKGHYYKVSVAGNSIVDGNSQWVVGDMIVFNGTTWDKIDGGSTEVLSVAGKIGAVTLVASDIGGLAASATTDTTNAENISSGTLSPTRLPAFTGDATSTIGSSSLTLANSGVTAGTYSKVTVDAKGRVTVGAQLSSTDLPTYTGSLQGSQVIGALGYTPYDAANPSGYLVASGVAAGTYNSVTVDGSGLITAGTTVAYLTGNQTITVSGDVSGSGTTSLNLALADSGVTAGTYTKTTVDSKGRVTSGAQLTSADLPTYTGVITGSQITSGLGFTPYNASNPAGYITSSSNITGSSGSTTNLLGGSAGAVLYQSIANNTATLPIGTAGQVLTVVSGMPAWANPSPGGISFTRITSATTLVASTGYLADTSGGAFTVNLPASPVANTQIVIADDGDWSVNNLTVNPGTATVHGVSGNLSMDIKGAYASFLYDGTTWKVYVTTGTAAGIAISAINATGTPSSSTYLRGDGTWATVAGGSTTLTGDVTGTGTGTVTTTLADSGVTAGTYPKVTVDSKGRVTAGSALASADLPTYTGTITSSQITTGLGFTPYNSSNPAGYITSSGSITGNASTATNVQGGAAGSILYQSSASTTTTLPIGATDRILVVSGGIPTWSNSLRVQAIATQTAGGVDVSFSSVLRLGIATVVQTAVNSFDIAYYRSAKYNVQITQGSNHQVSEILVIHNGTTASMTEYGVVATNGSLASITADVNAGNARLLVTMGSSASATISITRTLTLI